jgi:hypothetical protein
MTRRTSVGAPWLDSLARWTVRGDAEAPPGAIPADVPSPVGGTTRRTALRRMAGAAGAVALAGPLSLTEPPVAGAAESELEKCQTESFQSVYADFQACVKEPLDEFVHTSDLLRIFEEHPSGNNSKKAKKTLAGLRRRRSKAIKDLEFCSTLFSRERAEGEEKCHAKVKPPGEPGSGGASKPPGCETGYLLCGEYCCDLHYAFCQGCGTPTCCRIEGNCCPSG